MIKIAFLIDKIDNSMGGTERQILLTLENIDKTRFKPYLIILSHSDWTEKHRYKYPIYIFESIFFKKLTSWINIIRLIKFLKNNYIDIVYVYFRDGTFIGIPCSILAGVPVIISARRGEPYWNNWVELLYLRMLDKFVKGFILNAKALKRELINIEKISPERLTVIYNGFNHPVCFYSAVEKKIKKNELNLNPDLPIVVLTANLRKVKRVDIFLKAAKIVIDNGISASFLIIGGGELEYELKMNSKELNINSYVSFLGRRNDIAKILPVCDIGVLCSDSEALSNAIIEYMAFGLPVICTAVGGSVELIEDKGNGFLIDKGDYKKLAMYIQKLIADESMRESFKKYSLIKTKRLFNINQVMRQLEDYLSGYQIYFKKK